MPSWKKVITSGSNAALNSLTVTNGITGSLFGTASNAVTASYALTSSYNINPTISGSISGADYIDFSTKYTIGTNAPTWKEGRLFYDSGSGALALYNWEQDVTLNIGQEQWLRARNQTGVTITNGSVVRLSSAIGDRPTVVLAQSVDQTNNFSTANEIIGMATHDIEHGTDGFVTTFGLVNGLNTAAFAAGDLLWVSQSAGQFTNVPPSVPFDKIFVGIVARSNVANGSVFMTPLTSIHFHDISSVSASVYQQGDLWMYRSGSAGQANAWINTKQLSGSYGITGSLNVTAGVTSSLFGTSSWAVNASTASFVTTAQTSSFVTGSNVFGPFGTNSIISASFAVSSSRTVSASFASTASYVNTLNQNVLITGSLTVASTTAGASENTLTLGPSPAGGAGEGGQLGLNAVGGTYTSASFIDNYQNQIRILKGTNASSTGLVAQWNLHNTQMQLPGYTSPTAIPGTVSGLLAFDTSGNIITTTTGSGGSGVTINNNTDNYIITATGTANTLNGESGLQYNGTSLAVTGQVTASGAIISTANGAMYFRGGDDAEFWDINVANTVGIYGQQNADRAGLKLGSLGPTLFGSGSNLGLGTINPSSASLTVNGNVWATSFTGSLFGTASWANNATTATSATTATQTTAAVTFNNGGSGDASGTSFNGSTARTISYNTVGAPSTGGANATGTWGISITGNAATATTASFVTGSNVFGPFGSNSIISASFAVSSSRAVSSSFATTASYALTAGSVAGGITGTGTTNYVPKFTGTSTLGNSLIYDNGTQVGIGMTSPYTLLGLSWNASFSSVADITNTSATGNAAIDFYSNTTFMGTVGAERALGLLYDSWNKGDHYFKTFGTTRMFITGSTGNIGIGTTNPNSGSLHVNGNVFATSFTGSLFGTASWANNATTATNANNVAVTDTTTGTGPYYLMFADGTTGNRAVRVDSATLQFNATTNTLTVPNLAGTSSWASNATNATNATNVGITNNTSTAADYFLTFVANQSGNNALNVDDTRLSYRPSTNTLTVDNLAGNASTANTASFVTGSNVFGPFGSNSIISASFAVSSSRAVSASFASTASFLGSSTNAFLQNGNSFGTTALLGTNDNQPLALETNGTTRMFISSSGNVGIGTTSPLTALHIEGNNSSTTDEDLLTLRGNGENGKSIDFRNAFGSLAKITGTKLAGGASADEGILVFSTATNSALSEKMRITDSGNVGIGTTSPTARLTISGSVHLGSYSSLNTVNIENRTNKGIFVISTDGVTNAEGTTLTYSWANGGHGPLKFNNASSEVMRLTAAGNVGIGTTSPISTLQSAGTVTIGPGSAANLIGTMQLLTGGSSPINNRLTYGTDGTGWKFAIGKNQGGTITDQFVIQDNGDVGIGTTSPVSALSIYRPAGTSAFIELSSNTTLGSTSMLYGQGQGSSEGYVWNRANSDIYFGTNNTAKMLLSAAGNLGIGTTTPGVRFVNSGGGNASGPTLGSGTVGSQALISANGLYGQYSGVSNSGDVWHQVQRNDANTTVYNLLLQPNGGNVGIQTGTASTYSPLQVGGYTAAGGYSYGLAATFVSSFNSSYPTLFLGTTDTTSTQNKGGSIAFGGGSEASSTPYTFAQIKGLKEVSGGGYSGYMAFYTTPAGSDANTERMRINSSGNVAIGTTSILLDNTNRRNLTINGTSQSIVTLGTGGTWKSFLYTDGADTQLGSSGNILFTPGGGVLRATLTGNGAMGLGVTPTNTTGRFEASNDIIAYSSSDKNWKKNIKNIDSPLEKLSQINGVEFDWIEDEPVHGNKGHDIGVIAQEIEQVLPEIVQTRESGMKAVQYDKIIPLLIECIKDQQKQIEELKQIVNGVTK